MSAPVEQKIVAARFGTIAGTEGSLVRLPNSTNDYIEVSDYGCTIKGIHVHGKDGKLHNVLCGYETLEEYQVGGLELGAVTGTLNGQPLPTAHRLWNVEEIGENHLFLSCRLSAEDTPAGIACALGARIMWVNLNRSVIDLFATPEKLHAAHLLPGGSPGRPKAPRVPVRLRGNDVRPPGSPPADLCL